MIDPAKCCLFIGPGLKDFKRFLFEKIARRLKKLGGSFIDGNFDAVRRLPDHIIPIIGCSPELRKDIRAWQHRGRQFIYWDRGYVRRIFKCGLPNGDEGGYYRWHLNCYQLQQLRSLPSDRWEKLLPGNKKDKRVLEVSPWRKGGSHILVAMPTPTYSRFHEIDGWTRKTCTELAKYTDRKIILRDKESVRPLSADLADAHCLVAHGSNAANEAIVLGCPVFVDQTCAAALVGLTDLSQIEKPIYPDREQWLNNLAYSQFNEAELIDGTLWQLIS